MDSTLYLIFLAILDSINPIVIGVFIAILLKSIPPKYSTSYIIGVFASSLTGGVIMVFGLDHFYEAFFNRNPLLGYVLRILLGGFCIALGIFSPKTFNMERRVIGQTQFIGLLALGIATNSTDILTVVPFLASVEIIVSANYSFTLTCLILLLYNLLLVSPLILLTLISSLKKESGKGKELLERYEFLFSNHAPKAIKIISLTIGSALIISTVFKLV